MWDTQVDIRSLRNQTMPTVTSLWLLSLWLLLETQPHSERGKWLLSLSSMLPACRASIGRACPEATWQRSLGNVLCDIPGSCHVERDSKGSSCKWSVTCTARSLSPDFFLFCFVSQIWCGILINNTSESKPPAEWVWIYLGLYPLSLPHLLRWSVGNSLHPRIDRAQIYL